MVLLAYAGSLFLHIPPVRAGVATQICNKVLLDFNYNAHQLTDFHSQLLFGSLRSGQHVAETFWLFVVALFASSGANVIVSQA